MAFFFERCQLKSVFVVKHIRLYATFIANAHEFREKHLFLHFNFKKQIMGDEKQKKLFDEFPPVAAQDWENKINTDLKGADYNKKLIWRTTEGFDVRPYYRAENLEGLDYLNVNPGEFPFARGIRSKENYWEITEEIKVENSKESNKKALNALNKGATSLIFTFDKEISLSDLNILLDDVYIECIRIHLNAGKNASAIAETYKQLTKNRQVKPTDLFGSIIFDPIGELTRTGHFNVSEEHDFKTLYRFTTDDALQSLKTIAVKGEIFSNAGASIVQELGLSMAAGAEYLTRLTDAGLPVDEVAPKIQFHFGTGSNYFMEIAKLRAARVLWANIVNAYNPSSDDATKMFIHSTTSDWNKTIYDPHVNLLRTTTEAMSAIIGGTDSLLVKPFDSYYRKPEKWTERIARNTQIILKEEAYLNKVIDPGAGSYYIENLTNNIVDKAWELFIDIQKSDGYLIAFKNGRIQQLVGETANKRNQFIATRREVLLGTNQYPNADEKIKDKINLDYAFPEIQNDVDMIAEPLLIHRGAMEFEKLRLATEKSSKEPVVFLLTIGHPVWRKARAGFSSGFFACAGYKIIDNLGFATVEAGVEAANKAGADIVVICSSDDEYPEIAPGIYEQMHDHAIVVVAGAPPAMNELKEKGIQHFIHVKSNVLDTLKLFHDKLNITV